MKDFVCDVRFISGGGNPRTVHIEHDVRMVWQEDALQWVNDRDLVAKPGYTVMIDSLELWRKGEWLRTSSITPVHLSAADTMSVDAGRYTLNLDPSTRKILDLVVELAYPRPEPVITDDMVRNVTDSLKEIEMGLTKRRERPLRAKPL